MGEGIQTFQFPKLQFSILTRVLPNTLCDALFEPAPNGRHCFLLMESICKLVDYPRASGKKLCKLHTNSLLTHRAFASGFDTDPPALPETLRSNDMSNYSELSGCVFFQYRHWFYLLGIAKLPGRWGGESTLFLLGHAGNPRQKPTCSLNQGHVALSQRTDILLAFEWEQNSLTGGTDAPLPFPFVWKPSTHSFCPFSMPVLD